MALCEFGCPSLEYVYDMTWAEFRIRAYAYKRMEEREDLRFREVAWASLMGFHVDGKKLPKNKQQFWKIGDSEPVINERMRERMKQVIKEYKEKKNG